MQMVCHIEKKEDLNKSNLINKEIFELMGSNIIKLLSLCQKTSTITNASYNAKATLKQIATQEFQVKKGKIKIWKQTIMQEIVHKL